jgi:hypothetical protein
MRIERDMESGRRVLPALESGRKIETSSDPSRHGPDLDPGDDHSAITREWGVT